MEEFCAQLHGPWRGARTPSSPPNIGNFATPSDGHRTDGHRTEERDTLKSTYVKQLPLFGKATEVAMNRVSAQLDQKENRVDVLVRDP